MSAFTDAQIARRPEEADLLRKAYRLLEENGTPISSLFDGEEDCHVSGIDGFLALAFNLDEFRADCVDLDATGHDLRPSIWVVMGEEPEDMVYNYSTSLEGALDALC